MGYISLDMMKTILGVDGSALDDLIQFYIDSATQSAINIIGRDIAEQTITVKTNGNENNFLYIDYKPISAITSVKLDDVDITSDVSIVRENTALYYSNGFNSKYDYVTKSSTYSEDYYEIKEKIENIEVAGTFGYATIPYDVQNVVSIMVQSYYVSSGIAPQVKEQIDSSDFGRSETKYFSIVKQIDLTRENRAILLKYR